MKKLLVMLFVFCLWGCFTDPEKGKEQYQEAWIKESGTRYHVGYGKNSPLYGESNTLYKKSCNNGYAPGCAKLAALYSSGRYTTSGRGWLKLIQWLEVFGNIDKDPDKAKKLLEKAKRLAPEQCASGLIEDEYFCREYGGK